MTVIQHLIYMLITEHYIMYMYTFCIGLGMRLILYIYFQTVTHHFSLVAVY